MNKKNSVTTDNKNNVVQDQSRPTSRRKALKAALASGAVVTAGSVPAKWVAPVVNSVVLPSHARTSQSITQVSCGGAPEGCYVIETGFTFSWPGGAEPSFVPLYEAGDCSGTPVETAELVVAANAAEAALALDCGRPPLEIPTDPTPPGGCRFFVCLV